MLGRMRVVGMENILRKLLGYVWRHLANKEVIGLLVVFVPAISYSLLYVAYFQFYSFFGLRPADVGLDRTRLLQESLLGPFVFPLGVLVVHWQPALLLLVALAVMSAIGGVGNGLGSAALREAPAGAALGLIVIWAASAVYGYGYLVVESNRLGREVFEQGRVLPSLVLSDPSSGLYMPLIDVQALSARVTAPDGQDLHLVTSPSSASTPTSPSTATSATASPTPAPSVASTTAASAPADTTVAKERFSADCLIYLGRTETTYVLFDVRYEKVVRIFAEDAVVTVNPRAKNFAGGRLPHRCIDNSGNITPN